MTVMEEMGVVIRAVPALGASSEQVARWYTRKARLLERIAGEDRREAATVLRLAEEAYQHAAALLAGELA